MDATQIITNKLNGDILTDSGELGEMAYSIFHLNITSLKNLHEVKKKFN